MSEARNNSPRLLDMAKRKNTEYTVRVGDLEVIYANDYILSSSGSVLEVLVHSALYTAASAAASDGKKELDVVINVHELNTLATGRSWASRNNPPAFKNVLKDLGLTYTYGRGGTVVHVTLPAFSLAGVYGGDIKLDKGNDVAIDLSVLKSLPGKAGLLYNFVRSRGSKFSDGAVRRASYIEGKMPRIFYKKALKATSDLMVSLGVLNVEQCRHFDLKVNKFSVNPIELQADPAQPVESGNSVECTSENGTGAAEADERTSDYWKEYYGF